MDDEGPKVPDEDDSSTPAMQPASPGWGKQAGTAAVVVELAADLLRAEGRDGPAMIGQAIAYLLQLVAMFFRQNDQR